MSHLKCVISRLKIAKVRSLQKNLIYNNISWNPFNGLHELGHYLCCLLIKKVTVVQD